jgi:gamma-glutamyltranspeptidase / glutathione hydrolase
MSPLASHHAAPAALATLAALLLAACATVPQPAPATLPTQAPIDAPRRLLAGSAAVTTASPLASEAGLAMLRAGGNAVDAAVAASFAIGVVEPQMSGLGGSGTMLIWHQEAGRAEYLDFYAAQNAASFVGHAPDTRAADLRVVAIPGAVAGVLEAHSRHGRLPLEQVLAPAIALAEDGFPVGQILAQFVRADSAKLHRFPAAAAHVWPEGSPLSPGAVLRNPQLAATLRAVAARGRDGYYTGEVANALVASLNAGGHPASAADLAAYAPQWKAPLCAGYRGRVVLSAPPPQTGGQVIQTLKLLEHVHLSELGLPTRSPLAFDALVSALRVAMADNRGNDDPRWVSVPAGGRVSDAFAEARRPLVGTGTAPAAVEAADASAYDATPPAACTRLAPPQAALRPAALPAAATRSEAAPHDDGGETTHISVVDGEGNAVALTQTNSSTFGSGAFVAGFFLNDSGYRFDDAALDSMPATAWRTRTSTIAPTIVLEDGRVRMVTGAPGASRIPTEIAQTMIYVLDYGMDPLDALRMPRIFPAAGSPAVQLEHGFPAELLRDARSMGYDPVAQSSSYARLYMIVRTADGWVAVADPRHDGEPRGF